ncbi:probable chitinase 2 isoform X2 [Phymastichus coffea]|uniref:probable chitinase 2 isoform X2 n=1 Tax=Phymastichus coffea TaxID=108790 RepID=UPI00273A7E14|nr:probable chitinase 2 isoform X2 [Phymastichus coffea]
MLAVKALLLAALLCGLATAYDTTHDQRDRDRSHSPHDRARKPRHDKYVACYYQSWSIYRNGDGVFQIANDLKPDHCTHLIYAFAGLNGTTNEIKSLDPWADLSDTNGKGGYRALTTLKYAYPGLKISLAVGGWNDGSVNYSEMARDPYRRKRFINSVVHFLRTYGFDGVDLDWEFPTARGGREYDKWNLVSLLEEMRHALKEHHFILTVAISPDVESMTRRYDIRGIAQNVDYVHLMTYDYHSLDGGVVMPNAPLDEVNKTLDYVLSAGVSPHKFALGLPMYGRGYILAEPLRHTNENPIGKPSLKTSWPGPYNSQEGFFGYNEICKHFLGNDSWIDRWDNLSSTPYSIHRHKVVVYDNVKSLQAKVLLAMQKGLAGVMVWSIDTDDFRGDCAPLHERNRIDARDTQYPLMQAITHAIERGASSAVVADPIGLAVVVVLASLAL